MKVFTDTNYREHGARNLVEYLDKEKGLENRAGEEMSDEEIEAFIEKSEEYEFEREVIISPQNGTDLSDDQFSLYTRQVMSEFCKDRNTATYCYAIHRDTDHPHAQVAPDGDETRPLDGQRRLRTAPRARRKSSSTTSIVNSPRTSHQFEQTFCSTRPHTNWKLNRSGPGPRPRS